LPKTDSKAFPDIHINIMSMSSGSLSFGEFRLGARQGGILAALAVLAFLLWLAAYVTGLYPWTGWESAKVRNLSAGKISIIGSSRSGRYFGFKEFFYLKGQEAVLHYSLDVNAGGLRVYLAHGGSKFGIASEPQTVAQSGEGEIVYRIPESGFYEWTIKPTVTRGTSGYDLSYSAKWGARAAR